LFGFGFLLNSIELFLPPKPTTTPAPFISTTPRQRKKQHHNKDKGHHESKGRDSNGQNSVPRENDLLYGVMYGEGKSNIKMMIKLYEMK
jgi:hypothetical protein